MKPPKLPSATVARAVVTRIFDMLGAVEMSLFAIAGPCGIFWALARHLSPLAKPLGAVAAGAGYVAMLLVFVQATALTFCEWLRRREQYEMMASAQKLAEQREAEQAKLQKAAQRKGFRSFRGGTPPGRRSIVSGKHRPVES